MTPLKPLPTKRGHGDHADWRKTVAGHVQHRASAKPASGITAEDVAAAVQKHMDASTVAIIDGGECGQWAQAGINAPARLINGPAGAIGGCLCYAVAAKQARPDAQVIAVMGDGTAGFHFAEFETAVRENARLSLSSRMTGAGMLNMKFSCVTMAPTG